MIRVGIYIGAPAVEFIEWLEAWTQRGDQTTYAVGQDRVSLGPAQRRVLLSHHLVVEILGSQSSHQGSPVHLSVPVTFQVLPVGPGSSVEVIGTSDIQELIPYLVEFVSAVGERWPHFPGNAWFSEPPCQPVELCGMRIPTTFPMLEREITRFATGFATPEIRSVSFLPLNEISVALYGKQSAHREVYFTLRLSLHTGGKWHGIDHIDLVCGISWSSKTQPLTLTLRCQGFAYRELEPFITSLTAFCRSHWNDTQVLGLTDQHAGPAFTISGKNRPAADGFALQRWTLADRPWDVVADLTWDRMLVELWWQDYPSAIIARRVGVTPKTVVNRLSELRRIYGKSIIPTESQRRGRGREKPGRPG